MLTIPIVLLVEALQQVKSPLHLTHSFLNFCSFCLVTFTDPSAMIGVYLTHKDVACKYPKQDQFDAALKIFVLQEFTTNPAPSPQELNYNAAQGITQRLKDLRLKLESNKK